MRRLSSLFLASLLFFPGMLHAKELPKVAVWDLEPREVKAAYARELTSILVSEISRMGQFEVYSQDNFRTLAGWTAEKMQLGGTDSKSLTALGQMDITQLISGSVGKIGNRYSVSLNLFNTKNAKAENAVSELGRSEDELIDLVKLAVRMPIPVIPATHSGTFRPPIPIHSGRLFRGIPATPSERSDAGVEIFLNERSG